MSWITIKLLGYRLVSAAGLLFPQRSTLNLTGAVVEDDEVNKRTNITFTGTGVLEVTGVPPIVVTENPDAQHLQVACAAATTSSAGSLSGADKTKLDGLPEGDEIAPADPPYWLDTDTVPAALTNAVPTRALTAGLVMCNATGSAITPLRVNREGSAGSVLNVLDLGRLLPSDVGTTGTGLRMRWFLPDGTGTDTHVASVDAVCTALSGDEVSTRLVVSTMNGNTLGERLYVNSDGSLRALHYTAGRALFGADGTITSSAITEAEVRTALAAATADIDVNGQKIVDVGAPMAPGDAATKGYVDSVAAGLQPKRSVFVATTGPITLSGIQTIDSESVTAGKRVLVKDQADPIENGVYVCDSGAWPRADDLTTGASAAGVFAFIETGTAHHDTGWVCVSDEGSDVVDTDGLSFTQFTSAGETVAGAGLTKTGLTIDIVAADGSITVNADSIAASGAFGAKNISQSGATSTTSGSLGFIGPSLDNPGGAVTIGATATGVAIAPPLVVSNAVTARNFGTGTSIVASLTASTPTTATIGTPVQNGPVVASSGTAYDADDAVSRVVAIGWHVVPVSGATVGYIARLVKDAGAGSWSAAGLSFDGSCLAVTGRTETYRVVAAPSTPSSSSAAVTFDLATSQNVHHDATEDSTVTVTGGSSGQHGVIVVSQAGTGKTFTMPTHGVGVEYDSAILALGGGSYQTAVIDTTAFKRTLLAYYVLPNGRAYIYARSVVTIP